jgi:predicted AAA+ superfamily ATPase
MKAYAPRLIDRLIERKLKVSGGILLQGARAVGKTTTALRHANSFIRMDASGQILKQAEIAPKTLLSGNSPRLIDEWQLAPNLWNTVRHEIDARALPGQFILTGSAAPDDDKTRHTGAGRFSRLTLKPMTLCESNESTMQVDFAQLFSKDAEIGGFGGPAVEDYANKIIRGGWPALIGLSPDAASDALTDYVENVASVDLRTLESPPDPIRMAALMRTVARNTSTEASLEKLAAEAEIFYGKLTAPTVRKYLDQLTRIFVLEELPAWRPHIRSGIQARVKPKWHYADPSLAAAALRISPDALLADLNAMGLFFESLVIRDLRVYAEASDAKVFHYRDSSNLEIDAVIERFDGRWIAVEIKLGGEAAIRDAVSNFDKLKNRLTEKRLAELISCNIITAGENSYTRADGVHIAALGHLFSPMKNAQTAKGNTAKERK